MKSCDFLFLDFLRTLTVCYDNLFHCASQSGPLFLIDILRFFDYKECNQATPSFADGSAKTTESPGVGGGKGT